MANNTIVDCHCFFESDVIFSGKAKIKRILEGGCKNIEIQKLKVCCDDYIFGLCWENFPVLGMLVIMALISP